MSTSINSSALRQSHTGQRPDAGGEHGFRQLFPADGAVRQNMPGRRESGFRRWLRRKVREKPSFGRCRAVRSVIFLQFLNSEAILISKWKNQNLGKQIQSDVVIFCIRDSAGISVPVSADAEAADRRVQRRQPDKSGCLFNMCVSPRQSASFRLGSV